MGTLGGKGLNSITIIEPDLNTKKKIRILITFTIIIIVESRILVQKQFEPTHLVYEMLF